MKFFPQILLAAVFALVSCSPEAKADSESKDISVADAAERLQKDKGIVVLDIRTPDEYKAGHIEGAKLINFMADDFGAKIAELDKDTTYLMHCASGGRSGRAMAQFEAAGFKSILHLKAGFKGWEAAGQPVAK